MGTARGSTWAMVTKIYKFYSVSPILPILQKGRTTVYEHNDVIETQTINNKFVPLKVV